MCIEFDGFARILAIATVALLPVGANAHGPAHGKPAAEQPVVETHFGRTGDAAKVSRAIRIDMADTMRFTPSAIQLRRGETVRFVVTNSGNVKHEMVLGTMQDLKAHAEQMEKHPGMEHDEPYMAHVAPGETADVVWQFTKPGEFHYGCLIPGHLEAGMIGRITVR